MTKKLISRVADRPKTKGPEPTKVGAQDQDVRFKDFALDPQIKRGLSELGFVRPLEVQQATIPLILEGKDLIVKSQTGSGKTAAFGIPLCERVDATLEATQVVILVPTRELATQVYEDIVEIGKYKGVTCCAIYGKQPIEMQRKLLKNNPHIVIATPGRLADHLSKRNIKLNNVIAYVLDEADEMLLMGFKEQMDLVVKKLPKERQTLLFSATLPTDVVFLSQEYMRSPEHIEIESQVTSHDKIEQIFYAVEGLKKVDFMKKMLRYERVKKAIIFCNTQDQVSSVYEILKKWDHTTCCVHGGMEQNDRQEAIKGFKKGIYKFLIATDVAARGLHVQGVTHVVNYSVPFEHEQYIHRIGRTGRVDEEGIAISLVIPSEMSRFNDLQKFLGYSIPLKGGHPSCLDGRGGVKAPGDGLMSLRVGSAGDSGAGAGAAAGAGPGAGAGRRGSEPKLGGKNRRINERYKEDRGKAGGEFIQIQAGASNSSLKGGDILSAIRSIPGVNSSDIGRIEMRDQVTNVMIYDSKATEVLKALRTKRIKGKIYKAKKG